MLAVRAVDPKCFASRNVSFQVGDSYVLTGPVRCRGGSAQSKRLRQQAARNDSQNNLRVIIKHATRSCGYAVLPCSHEMLPRSICTFECNPRTLGFITLIQKLDALCRQCCFKIGQGFKADREISPTILKSLNCRHRYACGFGHLGLGPAQCSPCLP